MKKAIRGKGLLDGEYEFEVDPKNPAGNIFSITNFKVMDGKDEHRVDVLLDLRKRKSYLTGSAPRAQVVVEHNGERVECGGMLVHFPMDLELRMGVAMGSGVPYYGEPGNLFYERLKKQDTIPYSAWAPKMEQKIRAEHRRRVRYTGKGLW